jgi:predicted nucleic acid-binding protein
MILVDTSIWIGLLRSGPRINITEEHLFNFVTCGPVLQEVLEGLRQTTASDAFRLALLALPVISNPLPCSLFIEASEIYRTGRAKGHIIRSSVDCLIAAIAIENHVPLWHRNRDFDAIAKFTSLRIFQPR